MTKPINVAHWSKYLRWVFFGFFYQDGDTTLRCLYPTCSMESHIICLAQHFCPNHVLPIEGDCPSCGRSLLWGDLVRFKRGCYQNLKMVSLNGAYHFVAIAGAVVLVPFHVVKTLSFEYQAPVDFENDISNLGSSLCLPLALCHLKLRHLLVGWWQKIGVHI